MFNNTTGCIRRLCKKNNSGKKSLKRNGSISYTITNLDRSLPKKIDNKDIPVINKKSLGNKIPIINNDGSFKNIKTTSKKIDENNTKITISFFFQG